MFLNCRFSSSFVISIYFYGFWAIQKGTGDCHGCRPTHTGTASGAGTGLGARTVTVGTNAEGSFAGAGTFFLLGADIDIVVANSAPTVSVTQPDGSSDLATESYSIQYSAVDGDDYLGGAMITLHALGQSDLAYALFASVDLALTNRISAAHLFAASEGAGAAPLHDALYDVMCGRSETMPHRFVGLGLMGHRSGRDAFAGCYIVLRAYSRIKKAQTAT